MLKSLYKNYTQWLLCIDKQNQHRLKFFVYFLLKKDSMNYCNTTNHIALSRIISKNQKLNLNIDQIYLLFILWSFNYLRLLCTSFFPRYCLTTPCCPILPFPFSMLLRYITGKIPSTNCGRLNNTQQTRVVQKEGDIRRAKIITKWVDEVQGSTLWRRAILKLLHTPLWM